MAFRMPALELGPVERILGAVPLDDHQPDVLDPLERRVSASAGHTLAPASDRRAAVRGPGIDDAIVVGVAPRASHGRGPQHVVAARTVPAPSCVVKRGAG